MGFAPTLRLRSHLEVEPTAIGVATGFRDGLDLAGVQLADQLPHRLPHPVPHPQVWILQDWRCMGRTVADLAGAPATSASPVHVQEHPVKPVQERDLDRHRSTYPTATPVDAQALKARREPSLRFAA
jgi:hypothetical protein